VYVYQGDWRKAVADYSKVIDLKIDTWEIRNRRGTAYAELGEWARAEADFPKAFALAPRYSWLAHNQALALLGANDQAGYRKLRTALWDQFGKGTDDFTANLVTWTWALAPGSPAEFDRLVRFAEKTFARNLTHDALLHTYGDLLYRGGRPKEAVERLTQAAKRHSDDPLYWLPLAVAHHQNKQTEDAKKCLARAVQLIEQAAKKNAKPPWNKRLEVQLFRREAEQLIQGKPADPNK
jgi:Flp pilus assembly protein TadD